MRRAALCILCVSSAMAAGCWGQLPVAKPYRSQLDPLALRQLQTQEFETSKATLYASTVSVFQDSGFVVETGDLATGIITAKSPATRAELKDYFWMKVGSGEVVEERATAFVEEFIAGHARVRVNFIVKRFFPSIVAVVSSENPIEDPSYYERFFDKIREAVFLREAHTAAE